MGSAILVTGDTGMLGRHLVWRLLADEHEVRVLSRHVRPPSYRVPTEWAFGDLATGRGLDAALRAIDVVAHCPTPHGRGEVASTRRLVEAARRVGAPHLLYVSIVGADRIAGFFPYRAKLACERVVAQSGLPWTVVRVTQFHELIVAVTRAQRWLPVALTLGGGVRLQPVEVREAAARLAELVVGPPRERVVDVAGPESYTAEELTRSALRAAGRHRPVLPLRLPGSSFRAMREGALLAPEGSVGGVTFEAFLAGAAAGHP